MTNPEFEGTTNNISPKDTEIKKLLTIKELSKYLQIPTQTLYGWRHEGFGPPALKVGRALRYRLTEVDAWLEATSGRTQ
jgi:excisionase family DNA binding protein